MLLPVSVRKRFGSLDTNLTEAQYGEIISQISLKESNEWDIRVFKVAESKHWYIDYVVTNETPYLLMVRDPESWKPYIKSYATEREKP